MKRSPVFSLNTPVRSLPIVIPQYMNDAICAPWLSVRAFANTVKDALQFSIVDSMAQ